jgi:hypothetical protein
LDRANPKIGNPVKFVYVLTILLLGFSQLTGGGRYPKISLKKSKNRA